MIRLIVLWIFIINSSIAQDCQQTGCTRGLCCSKWGYCGDSPLHCDTDRSRWNTTYDGTCQGACPPGYCCSRWGYCGDSELHCSTAGYWNGTSSSTCEPACAPGYCCSKWGFCGDSPLHCENGQTNAVCDPPCRPGACCSKWGYCGDSELHCTNGPNPVTPPPTNSSLCSPACPSWQCCSKWGYCGSSSEHCDQTPNPASNETTMTRQRFDCIFDQLSPSLRDKRWQGYQDALSLVSFQPQNQDELMMFFAHASHETDGLKTYEEYCGQSGSCADDYQDSWCSPVQAQSGKSYYGRGWFQLSWPCNYHAAGQALGIDFLQNPEKVAESDTYAAATAMWFWKANNMGDSARQGNFAETTRKINRIECGNTPQQTNRIERYQKVRQCFGLSREAYNLRCY